MPTELSQNKTKRSELIWAIIDGKKKSEICKIMTEYIWQGCKLCPKYSSSINENEGRIILEFVVDGDLSLCALDPIAVYNGEVSNFDVHGIHTMIYVGNNTFVDIMCILEYISEENKQMLEEVDDDDIEFINKLNDAIKTKSEGCEKIAFKHPFGTKGFVSEWVRKFYHEILYFVIDSDFLDDELFECANDSLLMDKIDNLKAKAYVKIERVKKYRKKMGCYY